MKAQIIYGLVILIGMAGMLTAFVMNIAEEENTPLHWIVALLSMLLILIAVKCYQEERRRK